MERLRLSSYNLFLSTGKNSHLVYNFLSESLLKLDNELYEILKNQEWEILDEPYLIAFKRSGILVNESLNEYSSFIFRHRAKVFSPLEIEYTLRINNDCNLACEGCESSRIDNGKVIDSKTLDIIVNQIKREATTIGAKVINIRLVGGEIFLYPDLVIELLSSMKEWGKLNNGIQVMSAVITNGTLLNERLIKKLEPLIDTIQLTLEGDSDIHDQQRPYKVGKGSFNDILESIKLLSDSQYPFSIFLRLHVTPGTFLSIKRLISYLRNEKFHLNPRINVYPASKPDTNIICPLYAPLCTQDLYYEQVLAINKELLEQGFKVPLKPLPTFKNLPCPLLSAFSLAFDVDGSAYKCLRLLGDKNARSGYFNEAGVLQYDYKHFFEFSDREANNFPYCTECNLVPICNSGCAFRALNHKKTYNAFNCGKLPEIMQRKLKYYYKYEK